MWHNKQHGCRAEMAVKFVIVLSISERQAQNVKSSAPFTPLFTVSPKKNRLDI